MEKKNRYKFVKPSQRAALASVEAVFRASASPSARAGGHRGGLAAPERLREPTPQQLSGDEAFTHFGARLTLLLEREGDKELRAFVRAASPLSKSLPMLVHRRTRVTELLCDALANASGHSSSSDSRADVAAVPSDSKAVTPPSNISGCSPVAVSLLSLAVAFARDLRTHLESEAASRLRSSVLLVADAAARAKQADPVLLEASFQTLGLLVRYLYSNQTLDAAAAGHLFDSCRGPLSGKSALQRRLCAEALCVILRRLPSVVDASDTSNGGNGAVEPRERSPLARFLSHCLHACDSVSDGPPLLLLAEGVGQLIFYACRGAAGRLHSRALSILNCALDCLTATTCIRGAAADPAVAAAALTACIPDLATHLLTGVPSAAASQRAAAEDRSLIWTSVIAPRISGDGSDQAGYATVRLVADLWLGEFVKRVGDVTVFGKKGRMELFSPSMLAAIPVLQAQFFDRISSDCDQLRLALEFACRVFPLALVASDESIPCNLVDVMFPARATQRDGGHDTSSGLFSDSLVSVRLNAGVGLLRSLLSSYPSPVAASSAVLPVHRVQRRLLSRLASVAASCPTSTASWMFAASIDVLSGSVAPRPAGLTDVLAVTIADDPFGADSSHVDDQFCSDSSVPPESVAGPLSGVVDTLIPVVESVLTWVSDGIGGSADPSATDWLSSLVICAVSGSMPGELVAPCLTSLLDKLRVPLATVTRANVVIYGRRLCALSQLVRRQLGPSWSGPCAVSVEQCLEPVWALFEKAADPLSGYSDVLFSPAVLRGCVGLFSSARSLRLRTPSSSEEQRRVPGAQPAPQPQWFQRAVLVSNALQPVLLRSCTAQRLRAVRLCSFAWQLAAIESMEDGANDDLDSVGDLVSADHEFPAGTDADMESLLPTAVCREESWAGLFGLAADIEVVVRRVTGGGQSVASAGDDARVVDSLVHRFGRGARRAAPNMPEAVAGALLHELLGLARARWRPLHKPVGVALQAFAQARPTLFWNRVWPLLMGGVFAAAGPQRADGHSKSLVVIDAGSTATASDAGSGQSLGGAPPLSSAAAVCPDRVFEFGSAYVFSVHAARCFGAPVATRPAADFVPRLWASVTEGAAAVEKVGTPYALRALLLCAPQFSAAVGSTALEFITSDDDVQLTDSDVLQLPVLCTPAVSDAVPACGLDETVEDAEAFWRSREGRETMVALLTLLAGFRRPMRRLAGVAADDRRRVKLVVARALLQLCALADANVQSAALHALFTWAPSLPGGIAGQQESDRRRDAAPEGAADDSDSVSVSGTGVGSTSSHTSLRYYEPRLVRLVDDRTVRNELTLFRLDSDVDPRHRPRVAAICVALLYGKIRQTKNVAGARGAGRRAGRRSGILRWLCGCEDAELEPLARALFAPLRPVLGDSASPTVNAAAMAPCASPADLLAAAHEVIARAKASAGALQTVLSSRQRVGMLRSLDEMMRTLPSALTACATFTMDAMLALAEATSLAVESNGGSDLPEGVSETDQADEIEADEKPLSRAGRQMQTGIALRLLARFAELLADRPTGRVASLVPVCWIDPSVFEIGSKSSMSRLGRAAIQCLARCAAQQPVLVCSAFCDPDRLPLFRSLMSCSDPSTLDLCEMMLEESDGRTVNGTQKSEQSEPTAPPLELPEPVVCCMLRCLAARSMISPKTVQLISESTVAHSAGLSAARAADRGRSSWVSAVAETRTMAERALVMLNVVANRLEAQPSARVASAIAEALLPWLLARTSLQRLPGRVQRLLFDTVTLLAPLLSASDSQAPRKLADALAPLFGMRLAEGPAAGSLLSALTAVADAALPALKAPVALLTELSANDLRMLGSPDYDRRMRGFELLKEALPSLCTRQPQLSLPALLHSLLGWASAASGKNDSSGGGSVSSGGSYGSLGSAPLIQDSALQAASLDALQAVCQVVGTLCSVDAPVTGGTDGGELVAKASDSGANVAPDVATRGVALREFMAKSAPSPSIVRELKRLCVRLLLPAMKRGLGDRRGSARRTFLALLGTAALFLPRSLLGGLRQLMSSGEVTPATLSSLEHVSAQRRRRALRRVAAALRALPVPANHQQEPEEGGVESSVADDGSGAVDRFLLPVLVAQLAAAKTTDAPSQRNALAAAVDTIAAMAERMAWTDYCATVSRLLTAATQSGAQAADSALAARSAVRVAGHRSKAAKRADALAQRGIMVGDQLSAPAAAYLIKAACGALDAFPFRQVLREKPSERQAERLALARLVDLEPDDGTTAGAGPNESGADGRESVGDSSGDEDDESSSSSSSGKSSDDSSQSTGRGGGRRRRRRRVNQQLANVGLNELQAEVIDRLLPLLYDHISEMTKRASQLAGTSGKAGPASGQSGGGAGARRRRDQDQATGEAALLAVVTPAAARLCRLLPARLRAQEMPRLLSRACASLRSRSAEARAAGRRTLLAGCEALGPAYFHYVVAELRGRLRRGFQRAVLAHALHALLAAVVPSTRPGSFDHCVPAVLQTLIGSIVSFAVSTATASTEALLTSTAASAATTLVASADGALHAVSRVTEVGADISLAKQQQQQQQASVDSVGDSTGGANVDKTPEATGGAVRTAEALRLLASRVSFRGERNSPEETVDRRNGNNSTNLLLSQLPPMVSICLRAPVAALSSVSDPLLTKALEQAVIALGLGFIDNPDASDTDLLHLAKVCCAAGGADDAATRADDSVAAREASRDQGAADGGLVEVDAQGNPVVELEIGAGTGPSRTEARHPKNPAKGTKVTAFPTDTHLVPADPRPTGQKESAAAAASAAAAERPVLLRLGLRVLRAVLIRRQKKKPPVAPPNDGSDRRRQRKRATSGGEGDDQPSASETANGTVVDSLSIQGDASLLLLDPFVAVCSAALRSQRAATASAACGCLARLASLPLAAWKRGASARVARRLLQLAGRAGAARGTGIGAGEVGMDRGARMRASQTAAASGNEPLLAAACGALAAVLRARQRLQIPAHRLAALLELTAAEIDSGKARPGAVALLRALLARKLQLPAVYQAAEAAGRAAIRLSGEMASQCRSAFVSFLCNFPLAEASFGAHLDSLATSATSYELADGRAAALQVLADLVRRLPKPALAPHASRLFLSLVVAQGNDEASEVRAMAAQAASRLVSQCDSDLRSRLFSLSLRWYTGPGPAGKAGAPAVSQDVKLCAAGARALACFLDAGEREESGLSLVQVQQVADAIVRVVPVAQFRSPTTGSEASSNQDPAARSGWLLLHLSTRLYERLLGGAAFGESGVNDGGALDPEKLGALDRALAPIVQLLSYPHGWVRACACRCLERRCAIASARLSTDTSTPVSKKRRQKSGSTSVNDGSSDSAAASTGDKSAIVNGAAVGRSIPLLRDPEALAQAVYRVLGVLRRSGERDQEAESAARVLLFMVPLLHEAPEASQFIGGNRQDPQVDADDDNDIDSDADQGRRSSAQSDAASGVDVLHWLFRQLSFLARRGGTVQQTAVFKLFAGAVVRLPAQLLLPYLAPMLHPLVRASEGPADTGPAAVRKVRELAVEVLSVLQNGMGGREYFRAFESVHGSLAQKRDARKRERSEELVRDPQRAAQRKQALNLKNRERKKRKILSFEPGKNRFTKVKGSKD